MAGQKKTQRTTDDGKVNKTPKNEDTVRYDEDDLYGVLRDLIQSNYTVSQILERVIGVLRAVYNDDFETNLDDLNEAERNLPTN